VDMYLTDSTPRLEVNSRITGVDGTRPRVLWILLQAFVIEIQGSHTVWGSG